MSKGEGSNVSIGDGGEEEGYYLLEVWNASIFGDEEAS
jgi:hypothetical protein